MDAVTEAVQRRKRGRGVTREEATEILTHNWTRVDNPNYSESELDEAFFMAIEALQEVQKHEETFEWCHDCKEYDKDNYCCHRWSKTIRNTVEELKTYRPQGEWKHTITWQPYCSNCEYVFGEDEEFSPFWKFCPMCGAEMADNSLVNDITESPNDVIESQNDAIKKPRTVRYKLHKPIEYVSIEFDEEETITHIDHYTAYGERKEK